MRWGGGGGSSLYIFTYYFCLIVCYCIGGNFNKNLKRVV